MTAVTDITPAQLASGDSDAWELLRASYGPLCWRYAHARSLDAADIWQEAALRLWRALGRGTFATGAQLGAYLGLCVASAASDLARAQGARVAQRSESYQVCAASDAPWLLVEPAPPPCEQAAFWALVCEALQGLDAPLVLRCYAGGERPNALMTELGLSDQALYNVLRNGLGRLRRRQAALLAAYTGEAA